jgi:hypothetical protein
MEPRGLTKKAFFFGWWTSVPHKCEKSDRLPLGQPGIYVGPDSTADSAQMNPEPTSRNSRAAAQIVRQAFGFPRAAS